MRLANTIHGWLKWVEAMVAASECADGGEKRRAANGLPLC